MAKVTFAETRVFTKKIGAMITDESYAVFQNELARDPERAPVIEGTSKLRKIRWKLNGRGKSGGLRVIYLYLKIKEQVYLIFVFAKDECDNLSAAQKTELKSIVARIRKEFKK